MNAPTDTRNRIEEAWLRDVAPALRKEGMSSEAVAAFRHMFVSGAACAYKEVALAMGAAGDSAKEMLEAILPLAQEIQDAVR